jgi:hypothetical protein
MATVRRVLALWSGVARLSLPLLAFALTVAGPARAAEVACRFEAGVPIVPAMVAGLPGDFILDTGAPRTLLHETKAQGSGITEILLAGDVALAGLRIEHLTVGVADLDVRGWNLSTPLAGVIGADALKGYVVDVSYAPCRIRLSTAGKAPSFPGAELPLLWEDGRPAVEAAAADEAREVRGRFVVATGANTPVRLAEDLASVPELADLRELGPEGRWLARLPRVSFAGATGRDVGAGLTPPEGDIVGVLGGPVLAHFRLRFDFPAARLTVQAVR